MTTKKLVIGVAISISLTFFLTVNFIKFKSLEEERKDNLRYKPAQIFHKRKFPQFTKSSSIYQRQCNGESLNEQTYCNGKTMNMNGQKILTYSLFGKGTRWNAGGLKYKESIPILANQMKELDFYKDWVMRIYHDGSETAMNISRDLSYLDNVQFCNTPCLWTVNMANILGTFFRTAALGDPMVDVLCSRDLDAIITYRESMAVKAWYETDKALHLMRDNPMHGIRMLGGMWCFRSKMFREKGKAVLSEILDKAQTFNAQDDQNILNVAFFSRFNAVSDTVQHDSFLCGNFQGSLPFPVQRNKCEFIGCSIIPCACGPLGHYPYCPEACRPADHKDWLVC